MALMKCPKCYEQISSKAKSCPHCGYSFHKEVKDNPKEERMNRLSYRLMLIITMLITMIITVIIVFFLYNFTINKDKSNTAEDQIVIYEKDAAVQSDRSKDLTIEQAEESDTE